MSVASSIQEYDSAAPRSSFFDELRELWRYRDLLGLMVRHSIQTRYKRSALGVFWTLLNPLMNMAVFTVAFSSLFKSTLPHYSVYVLCGLIAWNFFTQTTQFAMTSVVWGGALLKRVYLPRTIFGVAAIGNGLVNLLLSLVPLLVIMLVIGHPIYPTWWLVPLAVLLLAMFSLGVGLFLSALAVTFVDVVDMYQILVQAWFFLSAVMYPKQILPANLVWYLNLNPIYNLLTLFRTPIYQGLVPGPNTIAAAVLSAVVALLVGWWTFTRRADQIAYRI